MYAENMFGIFYNIRAKVYLRGIWKGVRAEEFSLYIKFGFRYRFEYCLFRYRFGYVLGMGFGVV